MPDGIKKSCLVVDDSTVIRKVARRILEELNFEVREAPDGAQAMASCLKSMPDGILLDWNMPVQNGLEFLKELRGDRSLRQPIVIFCTTENDLNHIQEAIQEGADEYIMKPFDREIVQAKFAQVGLI